MRSALLPALLPSLVAALLGGCATEIRDARPAIERINANYAKIEKPLQCSPAIVSFKFRDADGRDQRFIGHSASIVFGSPRCLYFSIKHLSGPIAHIGSNDDIYWFWVDIPETRKLWWGTWAALEAGEAKKMLVPPGQLLDALMLAPPQGSLPDGVKPFLLVVNGEERLQYLRLDDDAWPHPAREMILDAGSGLPTRVRDYAADGQLAMDAEIGGWQRLDEAGPDAPLVPRRYVVVWPLDHAEMRLDLQRVEYFEKDTPFCEFEPREWRGEQELLDQRARSSPPRRAEGSTAP